MPLKHGPRGYCMFDISYLRRMENRSAPFMGQRLSRHEATNVGLNDNKILLQFLTQNNIRIYISFEVRGFIWTNATYHLCKLHVNINEIIVNIPSFISILNIFNANNINEKIQQNNIARIKKYNDVENISLFLHLFMYNEIAIKTVINGKNKIQ